MNQPKNPHPKNTLAHQKFSTLVSGNKNLSKEQMKAKHAELLEKSQNFLNYSSIQMIDFKFEADCISKVFNWKFKQEINA